MRVVTKLKGFEVLRQKLDKLSPENEINTYKDALQQAANPILESAKSNAPISSKPHYFRGELIQPGALKASLSTETFVNSMAVTTIVKSSIPWSLWVEKGHAIITKGRKLAGFAYARPFLKPAFESHKDAAIEKIGDIIGKAVEKI